MPSCAVFGCTNCNRKTKGTGIKYFTFPKDVNLSKKWLSACKRRDKVNLKTACVCSIHFHTDCYNIPLKQRLLNYEPKNARLLKIDAVPTLNLGLHTDNKAKICESTDNQTAKKRKAKEREDRATKRSRHTLVNEMLIASCSGGTEETIIYPHPSESSTQTSSVDKEMHDVKSCLVENNCLKDRIAMLEKQINVLNEKNSELVLENKTLKSSFPDRVEDILKKIFTSGQIKMLVHPEKKKIKWSSIDIAAAISPRSVSPKAYRYLRNTGFPLPALSTLRIWASRLNLDEGILSDVISLMKTKAQSMSTLERLTVLVFDEIYISNRICIDKKNQQKVGPHKCCQTVMARGLVGRWKQPIFYKFDQKMTKSIINEITRKLFEAGFTVVSITCDMGSGNVSLWSELGIAYDKDCYFTHPSDSCLRIFVYADVPHMLKLLRNHLLDQNFYLDGKIINKNCFESLLSITDSEVRITYKINQYHLNVRGSERQKVLPACQLLSNSIAKAFEYCGKKNVLQNIDWQTASDFIGLVNNWFDLFNSQSKLDCKSHAFGVDIEKQVAVLDKVNCVISNLRVGKHNTLIPFQKGILLCNRSILNMFFYLKSTYNLEYICTRRLNQDILENFFSYVRGMGHQNDHPSALDIKYRLRWYILGKHSAAIFTENKNTEENGERCLVKPLEESTCITESLLQNVVDNDLEIDLNCTSYMEEKLQLCCTSFIESDDQEIEADVSEFPLSSDHCKLLETFESFTSKVQIDHDALRYIAGYVAQRFLNKYPYLGVKTHKMQPSHNAPDWVEFISRGNLVYPSNDLFQATLILDKEFLNMHGESLSNDKFLFDSLTTRTIAMLPDSIQLPYEVILCLARTRTYIRLRELNKRISFANAQRKVQRKMSKFTNNRNCKATTI